MNNMPHKDPTLATALLAWLMDLALRQLHKACFPWAEGGRG